MTPTTLALPRIFWHSDSYVKQWRMPARPPRDVCVCIAGRLLNSRPVLDLGCGECVLTAQSTGLFIDIEPRTQRPDALRTDIRDIESYASRIPVGAIACFFDVLEHLTKADAIELIERLASRVAGFLVFSPIGSLSLTDAPGPHSHRSSWEPFEFLHAAWHVIEFPTFHRYSDGYVHGAFFAWTGLDATASSVARHCL